MAFEYLTNTPLEQAKSEYLEKLRELGMSPKLSLIHISEPTRPY